METDGLELPTQQLRDAAFERFGETFDTRREKLKAVRAALLQLPNQSTIDVSETNVIRYLRGQQFDVEKTIKVFENLIEFNLKNPQWTTKICSSEFKAFKSIVHILSMRDKQGRMILLLRPAELLKHFSVEFLEQNPSFMIRFNIFANNRLAHHPYAQVYGVVRITSFSDLTAAEANLLKIAAPFYERLALLQYQTNCCALSVGE